jgi:anti-sigma factor (TIGR02949 family)
MSFISRLKQMLGAGGAAENGAGHAEMISCEEALTVIYEFLDGELEDAPRQQVQEHFDVCQRCYPQLRLEESFRAAVQKATRGEAAPPELRARLLELIAETSEG